MIRTEMLQDGALIRHYTDTVGKALLQMDTGLIYMDAVDVSPTRHQYAEVDAPDPQMA